MGFSGPKKPVPSDETSNANEHNMVKDSTGRRQTSWLFTCVDEDLNKGLSRNSLQIDLYLMMVTQNSSKTNELEVLLKVAEDENLYNKSYKKSLIKVP